MVNPEQTIQFNACIPGLQKFIAKSIGVREQQLDQIKLGYPKKKKTNGPKNKYS